MITSMCPRHRAGIGSAIISFLSFLIVALVLHIAPVESPERPHGTNAFGNRDMVDSGEVKARISADKENPEAISGFVYFPIVKGQNASGLGADEDFARNVAYTLKQYTRIEVKRDGVLGLDSPRLQKYPAIFFQWPGNLTETEEKNLRNYLSSGGFVFTPTSISWASRNFWGQFARVEPIPADHPICVSLFKDQYTSKAPIRPRGIWIGKRLAGIDITGFQDNISPGNSDDRYRKLLASCMVYALTR
jgi:hypothetical protein